MSPKPPKRKRKRKTRSEQHIQRLERLFKKAVSLDPSNLLVGRVLHQDNEFMTLEIGKHNAVVFHMQRDENGEVVGGDEFFTVCFVKPRRDGSDQSDSWIPWNER